jgi:GNAT superfamily N-acetyltransferase
MTTVHWMTLLHLKGSKLTPERSLMIEAVLESDHIWSAYALADLDPRYLPYTEWLLRDQGIILLYKGLTPPILFAHGPVNQVHDLMKQLPSGEYQLSLKNEYLDELPGIQVLKRIPMIRMVLRDFPVQLDRNPEIVPLTPDDQSAIETLFSRHADAPDGYHPRQLGDGHFWGIWKSNQLITIAGIHLWSKSRQLAAIGNVFTHPTHRGHGLAKACIAAVVTSLRDEGIETIVLNVGKDNYAAQGIYQSLGFQPHITFSEGLISIAYQS